MNLISNYYCNQIKFLNQSSGKQGIKPYFKHQIAPRVLAIAIPLFKFADFFIQFGQGLIKSPFYLLHKNNVRFFKSDTFSKNALVYHFQCAILSLTTLFRDTFNGVVSPSSLAYSSGGKYGIFTHHYQDVRNVIYGNPSINTLFNLPISIEQHLNGLGSQKTKELLSELQQNYLQFYKWIKESGSAQVQKPEREEFIKKVYEDYSQLIYAITTRYDSSLLHHKLHHKLNKAETLMRVGGVTIILDQCKKKKGFSQPTISCESYGKYSEELQKISNLPDGRWSFYVAIDNHVHLSLVHIEKKGNILKAIISDCCTIENPNAIDFITKLAQLTWDRFPNAVVYAPKVQRQSDLYNCGIFVIQDIKDWSKEKYYQSLSEKCPAVQPVPKQLNTFNQLPLGMLKLIQSFKTLEQVANSSGYDKTSEVYKKAQDFIRAFTITNEKGKDINSYTNFLGIKHRLQIIKEAFAHV